MFAFAVWDMPKQRLLLARDHLGQKPLFFCSTPRGFAFASEAKSILASGLVEREIDLEALYHYISLRFLPDQLSLFKGVQKLPAGCRLVYEHGRERIEPYWHYSYLDKFPGDENTLTDSLDIMLQQTVEAHLLSDVPVGSFLSGGIDSSLITALMAKRMKGGAPATFSIGVAEQDFNELPFAQMVAEQYQTEHHEQIVKADLINLIPQMIWHLDEPSDPFGVGVFLVSQLASQHVKVVLSGDGGDELFAGYDRFLGHRIIDYFCLIPRSLRKTLLTQLIKRLPEGYSYKSFSQKLRWLQAMSELDYGERYAQSLSFLRYTEEAKAALFTPRVKAVLGEVNSQEKILTHFNAENVSELVDRMLYTDMMTRIPDHLLMIVDRMAMAHGLEARPPMLEHKFVEFAARIPAHLKLHGTNLKYILRRVASRYIDPRLITRKKQGFGFPLAYWMQNELKHFLRAMVQDSRFIDQGIFEHAYIQSMVEEHINGVRDHNYRIWIFINLEIWYRLFFEGQAIGTIHDYVDTLMAKNGRT
jgi:asparagine synthase (glutamine-hydrolysing)